MTYEELRQRCLNYAGMHPSSPCGLVEIVGRITRISNEAAVYLATDMARYIEAQASVKPSSEQSK